MKIAIPIADGKVTPHFGHCPHFAFVSVTEGSKTPGTVVLEPSPEHEPGLLPKWLGEKQVTHVIASGIGKRAVDLLVAQNICVVTGVPIEPPLELVNAFLDGTLQTGQNACDH
jgi:predicted Fe-Mo cluster-binding NifX family protein